MPGEAGSPGISLQGPVGLKGYPGMPGDQGPRGTSGLPGLQGPEGFPVGKLNVNNSYFDNLIKYM